MSDPVPEVGEIEADINRTRDELAETVTALSERLDVSARLHATAGHAKAEVGQGAVRAKEAVVDHKLPVIAVAVATVTGGLAILAWARRR